MYLNIVKEEVVILKITNINDLENISRNIRIGIIEAVYNAKSGHPGGSLSCADISTVLFFNEMNIDNKVETIMMLLLANEELSALFEQYDLYNDMYNLLASYSEKKIFSISDETLRLSTKRPNDLFENEYKVTEDRLDKIWII